MAWKQSRRRNGDPGGRWRQQNIFTSSRRRRDRLPCIALCCRPGCLHPCEAGCASCQLVPRVARDDVTELVAGAVHASVSITLLATRKQCEQLCRQRSKGRPSGARRDSSRVTVSRPSERSPGASQTMTEPCACGRMQVRCDCRADVTLATTAFVIQGTCGAILMSMSLDVISPVIGNPNAWPVMVYDAPLHATVCASPALRSWRDIGDAQLQPQPSAHRGRKRRWRR